MVPANDNESLNKVMATAYRCVEKKSTLSKPFCVLSRNFFARIVAKQCSYSLRIYA